MLESENDDTTRDRLRHAVKQTILACDVNATVLWEMSYVSRTISAESGGSLPPYASDASGRIMAFQPHSEDIAFDDSVLDTVKAIWETIMGPLAEDLDFMRFDERPGEEMED